MKISIYMALSANGVIENPKGIPDWLSQEYMQGFMKICQQTKAVIMGKKTYKILAPDFLPLKEDGTTIVLTNDTEALPPNPTVVFTNKKPIEIISQLEKKDHTAGVIIGGSRTASEFMQAGVVDDVYFVVEPIFFGNGLPIFKDAEFEYKLNLLEVLKLNSNTIQLHYAIHK